MSLLRMTLANYRCFARQEEIELSPVTIVLGRNNSGKSALARAPMVFGTGMRTDSPAPLDLDELNEDILGTFTDLVHGNRPHGGITMGLRLAGEDLQEFQARVTVQNIDEYRTQVVSRLEMQSANELFRLDWEPEGQPETMLYTVFGGGQAFAGIPVTFQGLLPVDIPETAGMPRDLLSRLLVMAREIRRSYPVIRYVGPFRDRPSRRYRLPARMPTEVGVSGENAAGILASDWARQSGELLDQVNQGLAEALPGWKLEMIELAGMYAVELRSAADDTLRVNLADAGTGVAQVLPIFVQRAVDVVRPPTSPVLEIIEQPELHLHPAAHGGLADLYLQAARNTGVRFIIETHSETLLLRLRRRIAEGLPSDMVAVYFVDHDGEGADVRRIHIADDGSLDYWPAGVFSEDYDETRALAVAQMARGSAGAR